MEISCNVIYASLLIAIFSYLFKMKHKRKHQTKAKLPPGSMGWPCLGETLQFYSRDPNVFFAAKQKRFFIPLFLPVYYIPYLQVMLEGSRFFNKCANMVNMLQVWRYIQDSSVGLPLCNVSKPRGNKVCLGYWGWSIYAHVSTKQGEDDWAFSLVFPPRRLPYSAKEASSSLTHPWSHPWPCSRHREDCDRHACCLGRASC